VKTKTKKPTIFRQRFADGSTIVTFPNGSMAILETASANPDVLSDGGPDDLQGVTTIPGSRPEKVAGY